MSWPLASFLIVALVLAAGWLAYERHRPSARMAAVVAVMAALAALGRDAFAALPDVKPITAMTFVVGYALGPIPGFTVGALGMLVSNFMLGQGPYTPWQMAAWGMVGLAGAALGRLRSGRLNRVTLALACGLAALVAKEVMNLYTWTLGASHTPAALLAVAGQGLAYDVTDAVASFLFAIAFAPELARVLARVRLRMEVTWEPGPGPGVPAGEPAEWEGRAGRLTPGRAPLAPLLVLLAAAALALGPSAKPAHAGAAEGSSATIARLDISREVAYLQRAQNADGGFGAAPGTGSSELYSAWAAIGLAAGGHDPLSVRRAGRSVLDALRGEAASLQGAGDLERTILALHACGVSVRSLPASAGGDPVTRLLRLRSGNGSIGGLSNLTSFAILALRAAGLSRSEPAVRSASRWLARQQNRDGGFGFGTRGGPSDIDDTAAAVQALVAAGMPAGGGELTRASRFLASAQNLDGGFPQQPEGVSNAQSTSWAVQGLVAVGREPGGVTHAGSRSPLAYLASLLAPDGSVRYSRTGAQTPVWVTAQALTALAARPFPIAPVARRGRSAAVAAGSPVGAGAGAGASTRAPIGPAVAGPPRYATHAVAAAPANPLLPPTLDAMAVALARLLGEISPPSAR